jgi:adenylyl- and sulfurtransferase ThiI
MTINLSAGKLPTGKSERATHIVYSKEPSLSDKGKFTLRKTFRKTISLSMAAALAKAAPTLELRSEQTAAVLAREVLTAATALSGIFGVSAFTEGFVISDAAVSRADLQ